MKRVYRYEVLGVTYYEGIPEGTSDTFDTLKDAVHFVENVKGSRFHKAHTTIFKYEERNGECYRYVKRIWINKNGKWISTRKVHKVLLYMEV
jgi:hypothetical protein